MADGTNILAFRLMRRHAVSAPPTLRQEAPGKNPPRHKKPQKKAHIYDIAFRMLTRAERAKNKKKLL